MLFTERLSWLMERNNTSVSELARAVGVSRQAIMGWKDGAQPTVDKILKVADYFGVDPEIFGIDNPYRTYDANRIPIVGSIRAGYPVQSFESTQGYVTTNLKNLGDLFALRVVGDSMMPLVMEGDIIICDKNTQNINNKICAVTFDNESTLKRVRIDSTGVTLIPTNPMYNEIHFSPKKAEEKNFHVDGVLVQMIRNF